MAGGSNTLLKVLKSPNLLREDRGSGLAKMSQPKKFPPFFFFFNLWEGSSKHIISESQAKKIRSSDMDI